MHARGADDEPAEATRHTAATPPNDGLSGHLVAGLRESYRLPRLLGWRRPPTGTTHMTWILALTGNITVVLRRYHASFDDAAIRYEHSILNHLARGGFPVPRVIPATNGLGFLSLDGARARPMAGHRGRSLLPPGLQADHPFGEDELVSLPEWMIRWRLSSLYYAMKRYHEQRRLTDAVRVMWSLQLVRWLQANTTQIRLLCDESLRSPQ